MGVCISKPAAGSKEAPLDANPIPGNLEGRGEVVSAEPAAKPTPPADEPLTEAPVKVYKDGKEAGVKLKATKSGKLHFGTSNDVADAHDPQKVIQENFPETEAKTQLDNLRLLQGMGVEVRYSSSPPFIGKLALRIQEVTGTKHVASTYVKVRCEGDRGKLKYASNKEGEAATFEDAIFIFVILHSNAEFLIKVKDDKDASFYGQAIVPITEIAQGNHDHQWQLTDLHNSDKVVGSVKVTADYKWLRDTKDEGSYEHASQVVINKRRMRQFLGVGAMSAIQYFSQVNHWMMSHDNIYNSKGSRDDEPDDHAPGSPSRASGDGSVFSSGSGPTLLTKSGSGRGMTAAARWRLGANMARAGDRGAEGARDTSVMHETTLMETLGKKEEDSPEVAALKEQLLALMLAMSERLDSVEAVQEQHQGAIEELGTSKEQQANNGKGPATIAIGQQVEPFISGTFEYGLGRPASKRKVFLFINKAQDQRALTVASVQFIGVYRTDKKGQLRGVPVPDNVWTTPGHYNIVGLLPEDNTYAKGSMYILEPGTKCIVFDMDGTITVGDQEVVTMFALDAAAGSTAAAQSMSHAYDIKARKHALHTVRAWAAKGYQPIYLSGRQGSYYNLTLEWLIRHHYPPGPIHLTRTHLPTLPIYVSVGNFKVAYMEMLKSKGLLLYAAYGNTPTDIRAYLAAGIPKERIFIVGPHGGKSDTVKVVNFTEHIQEVFARYPDATSPPIPYTELLFTTNPGYRKHVRVKGEDGIVRQESTIEQAEGGNIQDEEELEDIVEHEQDAVEDTTSTGPVAEGGHPLKEAVQEVKAVINADSEAQSRS